MRIIKFFEERTKRLTIWDIALIKYSTVAITLLLAKLFPVLLTAPLWVYLILGILFAFKPIKSMFCNK